MASLYLATKTTLTAIDAEAMARNAAGRLQWDLAR